MIDLALWLLLLEALGLLAFPPAFLLLGRLPDRGYAVAKPLGLLLAGYALWLLGLSRIIPNSPLTVLFVILLAAAGSGWLFYRNRAEITRFVQSHWRILAVVEGLFLSLFLAWCLLISEFPAINHTEKPMDFAFLNAILQSPFFPPQDPWLAGHPISYYYFGHFMLAMPMQLLQGVGLSSNIGYNLAWATLPALTAMAAFGLTYNLIRLSGGGSRSSIGFGLAAPLLIVVIGNMEGMLELAQLRGWAGPEFWQGVGIKGLEGGAAGGVFPQEGWWWWRATRVIDTVVDGQSLDYTITEFPFFSFLLGDLHPHALSLPFLLLTLSFGLNLLMTPGPLSFNWLREQPYRAGAIALLLGALAFVNIWDFPVYALLFGALLLVKAYGSVMTEPYRVSSPRFSRGQAALGQAARNAALAMAPLLPTAIILFLPFYITLDSQVSGILPVLGPGSRPLHFLIVIGLPLLLGVSFLLRQMPGIAKPDPAESPVIVSLLAVTLTPLLLWMAAALVWGVINGETGAALETVARRLVLTLPLLAVAGAAGYCALQRAGRNREATLAFPLLLLAAAAYLLAAAELFYLVDFFGNRMNTVFKFYYQAWLLLGIAGAFGLYYWHSRRAARSDSARAGNYAGLLLAGLLLAASLYYPLGATLERTGWFREGHTFRDNTLDGLAYIRDEAPGEYAAIQWLREEAEYGRMVEAVGDDYSAYGRVSAATGLPTVLGWPGHEHQWRGSTELFDGRAEEVAQIYQSPDPAAVRRLLEKYNIRYVYLGRRERASYGVSDLPNMDGLAQPVFRQGGVVIYQRATEVE